MITARISAIAIAITFAGATLARGEEVKQDAPEPVGLYKLKNRSSFSAQNSSRTPFWPIGHVKRPKSQQAVAADAGPRPKFSPEMFSVTSIVLGNPSLAIINGRHYGEGEFLRFGRSSRTMAANSAYRIQVTRIADGGITLQSSDGETINVPLRRPELNERKPGDEAELLLNDR